MMHKSKQDNPNRQIEMVVPFSLDETFEIIEALDKRRDKVNWLSLRIKNETVYHAEFQIRMSANDLLYRYVFFHDGELSTESISPPVTRLTWLARRYRGFDILANFIFVGLCMFFANIGINEPQMMIGFPSIIVLILIISIPINWLMYRYRRHRIRKKVENHLLEAIA